MVALQLQAEVVVGALEEVSQEGEQERDLQAEELVLVAALGQAEEARVPEAERGQPLVALAEAAVAWA